MSEDYYETEEDDIDIRFAPRLEAQGVGIEKNDDRCYRFFCKCGTLEGSLVSQGNTINWLILERAAIF